MKSDIRYGGWKYFSFLILDLICLEVSNLIVLSIYLGRRELQYNFRDHFTVMIVMAVIDIAVTFFFSSLRRVLRWRKRREIFESARHVFFCIVILSLYLFFTKSGAVYSRVIVFFSYLLDFILIVVFRTIWKSVLKECRAKGIKPKVLLMTTDRFAEEGIQELQNMNYEVTDLYLLKNLNIEKIQEIPVATDVKEVASIICWKMIDRVYIYGLDHQMVPEYLINACNEMKIELELVDFMYRVIDVKTIHHEDPKYGSLSFLEGKRDIPFPIRRVYWITETEADLHRGFHAHKLNCQLLYCPYGVIDIILDDGEKRTTVTLDRPGKGLILMPGLWREMVWRKNDSVLCVLASEYYDAEEYIRDYDEFISYSKKYKGSAEA